MAQLIPMIMGTIMGTATIMVITTITAGAMKSRAIRGIHTTPWRDTTSTR